MEFQIRGANTNFRAKQNIPKYPHSHGKHLAENPARATFISAFAVAAGSGPRQTPDMLGENMRDPILAHMRTNPNQPVTKSSLARHLEVPVERRSELRKTIESLISEGVIQEGKKATYVLRAKTNNALSGTLKFHPKGHAFFFPELTNEDNITTGMVVRTEAGTLKKTFFRNKSGFLFRLFIKRHLPITAR